MVTAAEANAMLPHSLALAGQIGTASIGRAKGMDENNAKLAQLIKGKQLDEDARKSHVEESMQRINDLLKEHPNFAPTVDETGNISLHPIDTVDHALKKQQLQNATDDREDRIKGRETNNIQQFYDHAGGKNYAQKAATLQKAQALFAKGDPESLRAAELELSTGLANNALTQQEYGALTTAHGAGNMMQAGAKNAAQIAQNVVPSWMGGDKLANFLSKRAANMQTMTPDEIRQKTATAQSMFEANRHSADSIRDELQQRASQLAPSMARRDPRGLDTVIQSLGARIPDQNITPDQITQPKHSGVQPSAAAQSPQMAQKKIQKVLQNTKTGQKKIIYDDGSSEIQ